MVDIRNLVVVLLAALPMVNAAGETVPGGAIRVIDGDTVAIGREKLRLVGIDAPDIPPRSRCVKETKLGRAAATFLKQRMANGRWRIERSGRDMFGRTLGDLVSVEDRTSTVAAMLEAGHARPTRRHRLKWCP